VKRLIASSDAWRAIHHAKHVGIPDSIGITWFRGSDRKSSRQIVETPEWSDPKARRAAQSSRFVDDYGCQTLSRSPKGADIAGFRLEA
jgi:hypothetical protein